MADVRQETLYGCLVVSNPCKSDLKHDGIIMQLEGVLSILIPPSKQGLIDTVVNSLKPTVLHSEVLEICRAGKFPHGTSELPFEVLLPISSPKKPIYETFHGNSINIHYALRCTVKRSLLSKPLIQMTEFLVEHKPSSCPLPPRVREFSLTPANVNNAGERSRLPNFSITGRLDSDMCSLSKPLTGEICVQECSGGVVNSIEVQLHRLETCGNPADHLAPTETSEVQSWQVCDGDVARGLAIPLCLPLPRVFTCATVSSRNFAIGFEVIIQVAFCNDHLVKETIPIVLER
ncbi:vacuolar protein sorting-associated protein 26C isoform X2 [Hyalella azteca]|uniref:Vacuolar protein sorting-associated protein 26C isoform X2 n=1 Tax=Hyalella azteca TaxID=294128 RepID=A0A979FHH1_HYAAZ|nr:vacuolar protein sorting-associated protein 26C isoform X2 [Hyalella azteca]